MLGASPFSQRSRKSLLVLERTVIYRNHRGIEILTLDMNAQSPSRGFITSNTISASMDSVHHFQDRRLITTDHKGRLYLLNIDFPRMKIEFQYNTVVRNSLSHIRWPLHQMLLVSKGFYSHRHLSLGAEKRNARTLPAACIHRSNPGTCHCASYLRFPMALAGRPRSDDVTPQIVGVKSQAKSQASKQSYHYFRSLWKCIPLGKKMRSPGRT